MKRIFALTLICLLPVGLNTFAGPESMETKNVVPPTYDWTGFYLGVQGGWRGGDNTWQEPGDTPVLHETINGGFGGLELGYNRQIGKYFVIGAELTGTYGTPDENTTIDDPNSARVWHFGTQNDWGGTFALRMGFTSLDNKLFMFVKGGGAVSHWNYDYVNDETLANSLHAPEFDRWHEKELRISPLVGAGAEYAIASHWSIKAEWNRTFLGEENVAGVLHRDPHPVIGGGIIPEGDVPDHSYNIDLEQDSVSFGLNYKF